MARNSVAKMVMEASDVEGTAGGMIRAQLVSQLIRVQLVLLD